MKYTVGKYNIYPTKPFKTIGEAVSFIKKRHPELIEDEIEKYLTPKINESRNVKEETKQDNNSNTKSN